MLRGRLITPLGCSSLLRSESGGQMAGEPDRGCSGTAVQLRSICPCVPSQQRYLTPDSSLQNYRTFSGLAQGLNENKKVELCR